MIRAIIDTGNFLMDPITKTPVAIVEREKLQELLPKSILNYKINSENNNNMTNNEEFHRIRLIPFKSIGEENGLLVGVKVDKAIISYQGIDISIKKIIIGIYNERLNNNGSYSALIGLNIFEDGEG